MRALLIAAIVDAGGVSYGNFAAPGKFDIPYVAVRIAPELNHDVIGPV
ncbi:MAG: hypothetical protein AAF982_11245 [Pseudomonadota bacterium]